MRAILFNVEETLVPFQTADRWQWAWRPQGPRLAPRHVAAALKRGSRGWDRRRWEGLTGAKPPVGEPEFRQHLREILWELAGRRLADAETEAVVDRFLRAPVDRTPAPDVVPTLEQLKRDGTRIAALGERPGPSASEELHRAGLREKIDLVCGSAADAPWPPSKEAFRSACRELGFPPREVAFVGHLYWSEVRAAHRAGLPAHLIDLEDWWSKVADHRLRTLSEVPAALAREAPATASEPSEPSASGPAEGPSEPDATG